MKILVLDGTEKSEYYEFVKRYFNETEVSLVKNTDRAASKIMESPYDLFLLSKSDGKLDLYDISDVIKKSKLNRKSEIILIHDNPTKSRKIQGMLRGRGFLHLNSNSIDKLCPVFERK